MSAEPADPGGSSGAVFDPYVPPQEGPEFTIPRCGCLLSGDGPPGNDLGDNGDVYVDETGDVVYEKQGDVWVLVGGGSSVLFQGHYGGNAPPFTPTTSPVIARDLDAPFVTWWFNGSSWS